MPYFKKFCFWADSGLGLNRPENTLSPKIVMIILKTRHFPCPSQIFYFSRANYELGRDVISPEGSVELNSKTGELVANGRILDTPQGVYTAEIQRGTGNVAVKQMHHIKNDRKLRYVLGMSRNEFGANSEKLKRQILEAIGDSDKSDKKLEVYFDEPMMDKKNSTWWVGSAYQL